MDSRGRLVVFVMIFMMLVAVPDALAQSLEFDVQRGLQYGQHDSVRLTGDLYVPQAPGKYPALVAVHGGGWQAGNAGFYRHWGPYLAQRGYVLFAIDYRLVRGGTNAYPAAVHDVRAGVQFLLHERPLTWMLMTLWFPRPRCRLRNGHGSAPEARPTTRRAFRSYYRPKYCRYRCGRNLSYPHIRGVKNLIVLVDKLDEGFARVDFRIDGNLREIKIFGHEELVTCRRAVGDAI